MNWDHDDSADSEVIAATEDQYLCVSEDKALACILTVFGLERSLFLMKSFGRAHLEMDA